MWQFRRLENIIVSLWKIHHTLQSVKMFSITSKQIVESHDDNEVSKFSVFRDKILGFQFLCRFIQGKLLIRPNMCFRGLACSRSFYIGHMEQYYPLILTHVLMNEERWFSNTHTVFYINMSVYSLYIGEVQNHSKLKPILEKKDFLFWGYISVCPSSTPRKEYLNNYGCAIGELH